MDAMLPENAQIPDADEIRNHIIQHIYHSEAFQSARMNLYLTCLQFMMNNDDCLTKWLSTFPKPAGQETA